jgi:prepilin signal peptidase PulO-like enzyme (type II secretory pathway)
MALAAAAVVNVLLWPLWVAAVDPPLCSSYFHYAVPCGHALSTWGALGAAVVVGFIVNVVVRRLDSRVLSRTLTVLGTVLIVAYAIQTTSQID